MGMYCHQPGPALDAHYGRANLAGVIFGIAGIPILVVNYKHLPKELHLPIWWAIVMIGFLIFYGFFVVMAYGKVLKLL